MKKTMGTPQNDIELANAMLARGYKDGNYTAKEMIQMFIAGIDTQFDTTSINDFDKRQQLRIDGFMQRIQHFQ